MLIYLDISETHHSNLRTGIQRVVRGVALELLNASNSELEVKLFVNHPAFDRVVASRDAYQLLGLEREPQEPNKRQLLLAILTNYWNRLSESRFRRLLRSRVVLNLARSAARLVRGKSKISEGELPHEPETPDYLLLIDSFWSRGSTVLEFVSEFKSRGTRVGLMIYDVIPLTHPQFVDTINAEQFKSHLGPLASVADEIFTISNFCKGEIRRVLPKNVAGKPITVVPLGTDVERKSIDTEIEVSPNEKGLLFIGTIEPRKNLEVLLDWWEHSGRDSGHSLTVVGKPGWKTDSLQKRLIKLSESDEGFSWLGLVTETELNMELRRNSIGVVPSFVEGYGLPVIEMAKAGLRVVASDIPVFREIAPAGTLFFNPDDPEDLGASIEKAKLLPAPTVNTETWEAAANCIVARVKSSD